MWFREFREILKILYYTLFLPVTKKGHNIVSEYRKTIALKYEMSMRCLDVMIKFRNVTLATELP